MSHGRLNDNDSQKMIKTVLSTNVAEKFFL